MGWKGEKRGLIMRAGSRRRRAQATSPAGTCLFPLNSQQSVFSSKADYTSIVSMTRVS